MTKQTQHEFIHHIFDVQKTFTGKVLKEKFNLDIDLLSGEEKIKWLKEFILSGAKEFMEMLDELPWKQHTDMNADGNNFLEEGVDTFKFLINCFVIAGYSSNDFIEKYDEKSFIVNFKYEQQKKIKLINSETKVAIIDIDGVINHYPIEFLDYVYMESGQTFKTIAQIKKQNYLLYKKLKHEYRLSGKEATNSTSQKVVVEFIEFLRSLKYKIVLLTARPYKKYNRLFFDTIKWLDKNNIYYDLIFFEREKTKFTLENFNKCSVKLFLDDDIENINRLADFIDMPILFENYALHDRGDYGNVNKKVVVVNNKTLNSIKPAIESYENLHVNDNLKVINSQ